MTLCRSQVALIPLWRKSWESIFDEALFFFYSFGMWKYLVHKPTVSHHVPKSVTEDWKHPTFQPLDKCLQPPEGPTFSSWKLLLLGIHRHRPFPCGTVYPTLGEFLTHPARRTRVPALPLLTLQDPSHWQHLLDTSICWAPTVCLGIGQAARDSSK